MIETTHDVVSDADLEAAFDSVAVLAVDARWSRAQTMYKISGLKPPPVMVGGYALDDKIGRGGLGSVYTAFDEQLGETIALKVLFRATSGRAGRQRASSVREAMTMAEVVHRNVVHVHKVGFDEETYEEWIAMQFIDGPTLGQWANDSDKSWKTIVEKYVEAGRGLMAAHDRGVTHGDFKPSNVLIDRDGVAKVTDFGLANLAAHGGSMGGTPGYMAPEQYLENGTPTPKTDQFAFAVSLFKSLTGQHPFEDTPLEDLASTLRDGRPEISDKQIEQRYRQSLFLNATDGRVRWPKTGRDVPGRIRRALERALRPDPDERYETLADLVQKLDDRRRRRNIAAASIACAAAIVGGGVGYRFQQETQLDRGTIECAAGESRYAEVWDEQQREALSSHFPSNTAIRLGEIVDQHKQRWLTARSHACEATAKVGEWQAWEPIDQCLQQRLSHFSAGLALLPQMDAPHAVKLLEAFTEPSAAACTYETELDAVASSPDLVRRIRQQLAQARAREVDREFDEGIELVDEQLADAESLDYKPVLAEVYYQRGRLLLYKARYNKKQRTALSTDGFHDLEVATNLAGASGTRSVLIDIAIFRNKARSVLGLQSPDFDLRNLLPGTDMSFVFREQEAELKEQQGLALRLEAGGLKVGDAVAKLNEAIDHFGAALALQQARGYGVGVAKVRANMGRAYVELGRLQKGQEQQASFGRAREEIQAAAEFWGDSGYGSKFVAPLYGVLINAQLGPDTNQARERVREYRALYRDDPEALIYVLLPGILAYSRDPYSVELAQDAMALLDRIAVTPLMEFQIRMMSLAAVVYDARAQHDLETVRQWSSALATRMDDFPTRLENRRLLADAYLGRSQLLLGQPEKSRTTFLRVTASEFWEEQWPVTHAEVLIDLAAAQLALGDRATATATIAEAKTAIDNIETGLDYAAKTLTPRVDALVADLQLP